MLSPSSIGKKEDLMRKIGILQSLAVAVLITFLGLGALPSHAQAKSDNLQDEVKTLNERVAQLERELAEKNNPSVVTPRGLSSTTNDDWDPFLEMQQMRNQMNQLFQDS